MDFLLSSGIIEVVRTGLLSPVGVPRRNNLGTKKFHSNPRAPLGKPGANLGQAPGKPRASPGPTPGDSEESGIQKMLGFGNNVRVQKNPAFKRGFAVINQFYREERQVHGKNHA